MRVQFIPGRKIGGSRLNFISLNPGIPRHVIGLFMSKYNMSFRFDGTTELKRINDSDESFIYVVIQDKPIDTIKTLLHELCHYINFRFFFHLEFIDKLIDKIDVPVDK